MNPTVPRAKLIQAVLKRLGVWQAGQDIAPEDYQAVEEDLDGNLAAMSVADVYTVEDGQNIETEVYLEIANYLAGQYAETFGLAGEELQKVMGMAGLAEKALRYVRTRKPTYQPMQMEYF
jgi:hypothetical protein